VGDRVFTSYKDRRPKPRFPYAAEDMYAPIKWGNVGGPGIPAPVPSTEVEVLGNDGQKAVSQGWIPSYLLQNPLMGTRVYAPKGSAANVAFGFRAGPTGTTPQESPTTGLYQSAVANVDIAVAGSNAANLSATGLLVAQDIAWKSGTAFKGSLEHANTADRAYTFQNASGTVAFLSDITGGTNALLDGASHTDTVAQAVTKGSLVVGNSTPKWDELVVGSNGDVLTADSTVTLGVKWAAPSGGSSHTMLSATHTDTVVNAVTRGSLIYGNATPAWDELVIGTSGKILTSDGTDASWQAPAVQTSTLLDGVVHTDTVAQGPTKGSIVVGNATPKWDELTVGTDTHVLTADAAAANGVKWAAPVTQTSAILDGSVHTDTVAAAVARGALIVKFNAEVGSPRGGTAGFVVQQRRDGYRVCAELRHHRIRPDRC
jgi:hypothetical protein